MKHFKMILLIIIAGLIFPIPSYAEPPRVTAGAAILMDVETGQVLFAKKERNHKDPASLTKIMTAIVALEAGNLDDVVTISKRAAYFARGSIIDIRKDEQITLENLLRAALIMSANDTTIAIAEHVGGGDYGRFVQWMNIKAKLLGACDTRFENTHGFTAPNHKTTAYDLALITRYALHNPTFAKIVSTKKTTIRWYNSEREVTINNTNRLLRGNYVGIDGVKTGTTSAAGHCLIASATRDGRQLVAVVLRSDARYQDAKKLLTYGFEEVPAVTAAVRKQEIGRVEVKGGWQPEVAAVVGETVVLYIPEGREQNLRTRIWLDRTVEAPVGEGRAVGRMDFILDGLRLGSTSLVAGQTVEHKPWYCHLLP
ncbi:MAG: D-alanyl-D-alanine carboxypeptidase [Clostridia bacterium]|nr:D-alanyl-D-alanine carboxypeptidase [Clostridia bacterium]